MQMNLNALGKHRGVSSQTLVRCSSQGAATVVHGCTSCRIAAARGFAGGAVLPYCFGMVLHEQVVLVQKCLRPSSRVEDEEHTSEEIKQLVSRIHGYVMRPQVGGQRFCTL